jgi:hypothetical protein
LDKLVLIDVELIVHILGFPSWGMDPMQFLNDKTKEKELMEEMKKKVIIEGRRKESSSKGSMMS